MEITESDENEVVEPARREVVASHGRSFAEVDIALFQDGLYRYSTRLRYSYGGFGGPIFEDSEGFSSYQQAREAALKDLLRCWHKPFPSEPQSVHVELNAMRQQIEDQLRQPSLF